MNIQSKITKLMKENKISASALSREISIPNSTLADILKGKTERIAINVMYPLAEFFGCSVDYLVKDEITDINHGKALDLDITSDELGHIKQYRLLNSEGQRRVDEYIEDLVSGGRHKKGTLDVSKNDGKEKRAG